MIAPPGAPGAATIAIPRTKINAVIDAKSTGNPYMSKTAIDVHVIAIILPAKWMVAPSGTTKFRIVSDTPFFFATSTLTGIVAAEDCVPNAV